MLLLTNYDDMMNEMAMDQLITLHKSKKKEWDDDGLAYSTNQTPY